MQKHWEVDVVVRGSKGETYTKPVGELETTFLSSADNAADAAAKILRSAPAHELGKITPSKDPDATA